MYFLLAGNKGGKMFIKTKLIKNQGSRESNFPFNSALLYLYPSSWQLSNPTENDKQRLTWLQYYFE
jgi:hypothetical protein